MDLTTFREFSRYHPDERGVVDSHESDSTICVNGDSSCVTGVEAITTTMVAILVKKPHSSKDTAMS